jgi:hypothetical protein
MPGSLSHRNVTIMMTAASYLPLCTNLPLIHLLDSKCTHRSMYTITCLSQSTTSCLRVHVYVRYPKALLPANLRLMSQVPISASPSELENVPGGHGSHANPSPEYPALQVHTMSFTLPAGQVPGVVAARLHVLHGTHSEPSLKNPAWHEEVQTTPSKVLPTKQDPVVTVF